VTVKLISRLVQRFCHDLASHLVIHPQKHTCSPHGVRKLCDNTRHSMCNVKTWRCEISFTCQPLYFRERTPTVHRMEGWVRFKRKTLVTARNRILTSFPYSTFSTVTKPTAVILRQTFCNKPASKTTRLMKIAWKWISFVSAYVLLLLNFRFRCKNIWKNRTKIWVSNLTNCLHGAESFLRS
jgi:hypothetical protein